MDPGYESALSDITSRSDTYMSFRVGNSDFTMASDDKGGVRVRYPGGYSEIISADGARLMLSRFGRPTHVRVMRRTGPASFERGEYKEIPGGYAVSSFAKKEAAGSRVVSVSSASTIIRR